MLRTAGELLEAKGWLIYSRPRIAGGAGADRRTGRAPAGSRGLVVFDGGSAWGSTSLACGSSVFWPLAGSWSWAALDSRGDSAVDPGVGRAFLIE